MSQKASTVALATVIVVAVVVGVVAFLDWIVMLIWGAIAARHNWYQFGFWEIAGLSYLVGHFGTLWNRRHDTKTREELATWVRGK